MNPPDPTNVLPFELVQKKGKEEIASLTPQLAPEDCFYYTLDLLMEDFGKKHQLEHCILCNPMRVYGEHRDEVIFRLLLALFYRFFPSPEDYLSDTRKTLMEGLLTRKNGKGYSSVQEKLMDLLKGQIRSDLQDFGNEIQRHLKKFAQVEILPLKLEEILQRVMLELEDQWIQKVR